MSQLIVILNVIKLNFAFFIVTLSVRMLCIVMLSVTFFVIVSDIMLIAVMLAEVELSLSLC
jgi:hypothetical protein